MESSDPTLSLYLHVPFCRSKCLYCDFFSVHGQGEEQSRVVTETIAQAGYLSDRLGHPKIETIYVGGGTPSCLDRRDLSRLLGAWEVLAPAEWTVEANPESLDAEFLQICSDHGVSRLSIGFQSSQDRLLELLGRPGRSAHNARCLELLAGRWDGEASLDFLAGIPGQTVTDLERDLTMFDRRSIGHVSLYSLTVEPDTGLERGIRSKTIRPNGAETDEELWLAGKSFLESSGYKNYEISNFAIPGKECRHNLRYWRLDPYLGVGPAAVSTLSASMAEAIGGRAASHARDFAVVRLTNPESFDAYLRGPESLWGIEAEGVDERDFLLETLMMGFRTSAGIRRESFARRFGRDFESLFPGLWERWVKEGLASADEAILRLTERGRLFLNPLLSLIEERVHGNGLLPIHVSWP